MIRYSELTPDFCRQLYALAAVMTERNILFCYDDEQLISHFKEVADRAYVFADVMMERNNIK